MAENDRLFRALDRWYPPSHAGPCSWRTHPTHQARIWAGWLTWKLLHRG